MASKPCATCQTGASALEALGPCQISRAAGSGTLGALSWCSSSRARRGSAVFFGCAGLDGLRARRRTAAYAASKSALLVLAKSWALEEAVHGVRINMVSPGQVPHAHASADTRDPAAWERIPLGRPGAPREVADVVAWLCSPQSSYVTGTDVQVAGGYLL